MDDAERTAVDRRSGRAASSEPASDWLACQALAGRLGLSPDQTDAVARVLLEAVTEVHTFDELDLDDVEPAVGFAPHPLEASRAG